MKQCYCFLKKFNNYFNRKIIKYSTLEDYKDHSEEFFIPVTDNGAMTEFDFNPNDNVMTEIIANSVPFEPDYFLLLDKDANIVQRWFVMEQKRNRQGQWTYTLRRDVVSDNLDNLRYAPIFVEKGMLKEEDPFIVNDEGMSLNQIKQKETRLLDKSQSSWIVGYMAKNAGGGDVSKQLPDEALDIEYTAIEDIASQIGISTSLLLRFLNFGDEQSNISYFTSQIKLHFNMKEQYTVFPFTRHFYPYDFVFTSDFSSGSGGRDLNTGAIGHRPYLFMFDRDLNTPYPINFANNFISAVIDNKSTWMSEIASILQRDYYLDSSKLSILRSYNGKYVRYNGEYYRFNISERGSHKTNREKIPNNGTYSAITNTVNRTKVLTTSTNLIVGPYDPSDDEAFYFSDVTSIERECVISLKYLSSDDFIPELKSKLSSTRKVTGDQQYDIFAIPLNIFIRNSGSSFETIDYYSRIIASAFSLDEDAKMYDLQLLPYCPIPNLVTSNNLIDITNLSEDVDYNLITKNVSNNLEYEATRTNFGFSHVSDNKWNGYCPSPITLPDIPAGKTAVVTGVYVRQAEGESVTNIQYTVSGQTIDITFEYEGAGYPSVDFDSQLIVIYYYEDETPCGIVFYVSSATFSTVIDQKIEINKSKKVISNCYMWRLNSPNYQGSFDFNIAKNGGSVSSFNVFCTYKPYTPFIKVAPNFAWLYGMEYQDNRGLLCGGDFSLPRVSDPWINYELNNKNYQNIFNREIEHLDYVQGLEMRNQLVSGAVGILSDASKGAMAGGMATASPYGAIAGAIVGAGSSAVGYAIDVDTMARTHRENKQLAIDKYNYQLGNIKALPYTLTKVGSFDAISKIFPFVEEYSCSDKELEAFENKIKYESMTVMRIGNMDEFMNLDDELHYFKGSLIRNDEIADDTHILNAIYEELLKGVYI